MATTTTSTMFLFGKIFCLLCAVHSSFTQSDMFDSFFGSNGDCVTSCSNTYPPHTYENAGHLSCCMRGCRLFNIIDFVNDCSSINQTKESCVSACGDAYGDEDEQSACARGCEAQVPVTVRKHDQFAFEEQQMAQMFPFMFVHNMYNNMMDRISPLVSVRWSFYMQEGNGKVMMIRSEGPSVSGLSGYDDIADDLEEGEYKTSNYIETNLEPIDNSATPNLKHSQVDRQGREMNFAVMEEGQASDWLSCVAKKTGLPRLVLSFTIFLSAMVMVWLCVTTAVTAPEHRVKQQKLSIYGDLEYLRSLDDEKPLLSTTCPQDDGQNAPPLPIKIQVHKI